MQCSHANGVCAASCDGEAVREASKYGNIYFLIAGLYCGCTGAENWIGLGPYFSCYNVFVELCCFRIVALVIEIILNLSLL